MNLCFHNSNSNSNRRTRSTRAKENTNLLRANACAFFAVCTFVQNKYALYQNGCGCQNDCIIHTLGLFSTPNCTHFEIQVFLCRVCTMTCIKGGVLIFNAYQALHLITILSLHVQTFIVVNIRPSIHSFLSLYAHISELSKCNAIIFVCLHVHLYIQIQYKLK